MKTRLVILLIITTMTCKGQTFSDIIRDIRTEYKLTNSNRLLTKDSIELSRQSTEAGQLITLKDTNKNTRKLIATYYGESGKLINEYYLKNNKLIFYLTRQFVYNRPIYWDMNKAKENNDSEVFDISKSKVIENRYYFDSNEKLILFIDKDKKNIRATVQLEKFETDILKEYKTLKTEIK